MEPVGDYSRWGWDTVERNMLGRCKTCERPLSVLVPSGKQVRETVKDPGTMYARVVKDVTYRTYARDAHGLQDWDRRVECPVCGENVVIIPVAGKINNDQPCDARCTSAKGNKCECECGGHNHGSDWR